LKLGLSANASQLNNITIDDGSRSAIQQALVQGLEVTVHQSPITVNGWQGSGYSVLDPETGVGAYQISGGASGGFLILVGFIAIAVIAIAPILLGGLSFLSLLGIILAINQAFDFADRIDNYNPNNTADINGDVFLLVIESVVVGYMAKYAAGASGIIGKIRSIWDVVITTAIGIFGGIFAEL
jgi:hypothetical protein